MRHRPHVALVKLLAVAGGGRCAWIYSSIRKYGVTAGLRGSLLRVGGVASVGPKEGPCAADPALCLSGYCCRWW